MPIVDEIVTQDDPNKSIQTTEEKVPSGILVPPEEIKNIINTTASFVARVGANFESKVFSKEKNNPKFSFLQNTDQYHPYYHWKIQEHRDKLGDEAAPVSTLPVSEREPQQPQETNDKEENQKEEHPLLAQLRREKSKKLVVQAPPPNYEFLLTVPYDLISAQDLDIMKLTAQFVAQNGRNFHFGLTNREFKNPQYDFLKPNHHLHPLFSALVDSYTKCLLPQRGLSATLNGESIPKDRGTISGYGMNEAKKNILNRILYRMEWEKEILKQRKNLEDKEQEERIARALIDWQDFVVVEKIDFEDDEDEEAEGEESVPGTSVGGGGGEDDDVAMDEEEMLTEETEIENIDLSKPEPEPEMKIRKDFVGRVQPQTGSAYKNLRYAICPQCGQAVPVEEMEEHMRIETSDPKARELKKQQQDKQRESSLAQGDEIIKYLGKFAKRRTDIFGDSEELEIGKEHDDSNLHSEHSRISSSSSTTSSDKVIWDGHSGSIPSTMTMASTYNQSGSANTSTQTGPTPGMFGPNRGPTMSLEEQIAAIHANKNQQRDDKKEPLLPTPKQPVAPSLGYHPPPGAPGYSSISTAYANTASSTSDLSSSSIPSPYQTSAQLLSSHYSSQPHHLMHQPPHHLPPHLSHLPPHLQNQGQLQSNMSSSSTSSSQSGPYRGRPNAEEEPISKKQKTEEPQLIPEDEFIKSHPDPVTIYVQIPDSSRPEWNWNSQKLELGPMKVSQLVSELKESIRKALGNTMPLNKQKLKLGEGNVFLKDNVTLASYNIDQTVVLLLGVRERGGRK